METTTDTRTAQLAEAVAKRDAARAKYNSLNKWGKAKSAAADDLEFWMGKVAFLEAWIKNEAAA